ncbi:hypothetical protein [Thalassoroseus pseudoceratinae]|uniref:hypothetical protein n=1 Tax=Thalassoroseus pseudoceratinae TaxID=2713176 RepID=UPI0014220214|nr:hypothetical protein [Thalassoroseus pseudoceratinae]
MAELKKQEANTDASVIAPFYLANRGRQQFHRARGFCLTASRRQVLLFRQFFGCAVDAFGEGVDGIGCVQLGQNEERLGQNTLGLRHVDFGFVGVDATGHFVLEIGEFHRCILSE